MTPTLAKALFLSAVLTALAVLLCSCAEVVRPPGGPIDKTGPTLMGSVPPNGAINVPADSVLVLYFSEHIVEPLSGNAVFVSPRPEEPPHVKWKSDRIELTFNKPFSDNQTYVVSVSSDVKDLRGNAIDTGMVVAFSTGETIDSGSISGLVLSNGKPEGGILVGLYDPALVQFGDSVVIDSIFPGYLSQSSTNGRFQFHYLPKGTYILLAFEDRDGNQQLDAAREQYAIPDRAIKVNDSGVIENLRLDLTVRDTASIRIVSCTIDDDNLIKVRINKQISLKHLKDYYKTIVVHNLADESNTYSVTGLREVELDKSDLFHISVPSIDTGLFSLTLEYQADMTPLGFDSLVVKETEDSDPPVVLEFIPASYGPTLEGLTVSAHFSEPIDTAALSEGSFVLRDGNDEKLPLTVKWPSVFRALFESASFTGGEQYLLGMAEFEILDLAGNRLGDSAREYKFSVVGPDSIGWLSGEVDILLPGREEADVVVWLESAAGRIAATSTLSAENRAFNFELPSGKYLLHGHVDSNKDGERFGGSLAPFRFAEPIASYPDTIIVRPRFETSEINFEIR